MLVDERTSLLNPDNSNARTADLSSQEAGMAHQGETSEQDGDVENGPKDDVPSMSKSAGWLSRDFVMGPVAKTHSDLLLLAQCLSTGAVDAASFSNWAVFCGMQTGNTIILGLSAAAPTSQTQNPHAWTTTLVSIVSYLLGVLFTFQLTRYLYPEKGITSSRLYFSFILFLQAILVLLSAALVQGDVVPHNPSGLAAVAGGANAAVTDSVRIVALLPPLAFGAGVQIATSRLLGFSELPVNVVTSTYCDIMGDSAVFRKDNVKRNRRVASVVLLLGGAVSSGWLMRSTGGMAAALFVAGGVKLVVAIAAFVGLKREIKESS